MSDNYDRIVRFMIEYVREYTDGEQLPNTLDAMDAYWAEDLEFVVYIDGNEAVHGREAFKLTNTKPAVKEVLELLELNVDERRLKADAIIRTTFVRRDTDETTLDARFHTLYTLADRAGSLIIVRMDFFFEMTPQTQHVLDFMYAE